MDPQGKGPGATQTVENTQRSLDSSNTDFNSGAHSPIRSLFDTEAEQPSLTLHQLQSEVKRLTALLNNRLGGHGVIQRRRTSLSQEQEAMQEVKQGETGIHPRGDWKRKMGTEEGAKEPDRAPSAKSNTNTKGAYPGDPFRGQATGYRSARPSKP